MLVLSRHVHESLCVGDDRLLRVDRIDGDQVTLLLARRSTEFDFNPKLAARMGIEIRDGVTTESVDMKRNDEHSFGPDVNVVVVDIRGDKVQLGLQIPKGFAVHRKELRDAFSFNMDDTSQFWPDELS
jgi:sRNA-binding carbon storage regulator CsrA